MNEESKLSKLQKSLYSRTTKDVVKRKVTFKPEDSQVPKDWQHREEDIQEKPIEYQDNQMSFFTKLFIGSLIFFILALGVSLFVLFRGGNIVSPDNIDITVSGPLSVGAGDDFSFDVKVYNKNNIKLEVVDLNIEFPNGTIDPDDAGKEYKRYAQLLDDIEPGGFSEKTVRAIMYGEENIKKTIMINFSYRIKGSNVAYKKQKPYEVVINAAPVSLKIESFKEIQSNQEFDITLEVSSNSQQILKDMLVKATYPFGFYFIGSDIKPFNDNSTWDIGDLKPQEKKTIKIKGRIEGQDSEERVFRFATGLANPKNERLIGTEFVSSIQSTIIKKPFLTTNLILDGDERNTDYIASVDREISADIEWFNNLPDSVTDVEITAKFSGIIFDKNSVDPDEGLFRSAENQIIWNPQTTSDLRRVEAGDRGRVSFSFTPKTKGGTNQSMKIDISVKARRTSEDNVPETLTSTTLRNIKFASSAGISGVVVRSTGPFQNTGPIPPKSEQVTTYTVVWTLGNSGNIANAEVRSSLPAYVKWLGKTSPSSEDIMYNETDGTIVWNIGDISANSNIRREVAFQVALEPSVNQIGQMLTLVNEASFKAIDIFTNTGLYSTRSALTTSFSTDPSFKSGNEVVSP